MRCPPLAARRFHDAVLCGNFTAVALHHGNDVSEVIKWIQSSEGQEFLRAVRKHGLQIEYGRYFFWGDDGQPWCRCPKCAEVRRRISGSNERKTPPL